MAPEVLNREKYTDKADIWSLFVVTYELLAKQPLKAHGRSEEEIIGSFPPLDNRAQQFLRAMCRIDPVSRPSAANLVKMANQPRIAAADEVEQLPTEMPLWSKLKSHVHGPVFATFVKNLLLSERLARYSTLDAMREANSELNVLLHACIGLVDPQASDFRTAWLIKTLPSLRETLLLEFDRNQPPATSSGRRRSSRTIDAKGSGHSNPIYMRPAPPSHSDGARKEVPLKDLSEEEGVALQQAIQYAIKCKDSTLKFQRASEDYDAPQLRRFVEALREALRAAIVVGMLRRGLNPKLDLAVYDLLNNPGVALKSEEESIRCLTSCIKAGQSTAARAEGGELVIVFGHTGAGDQSGCNKGDTC